MIVDTVETIPTWKFKLDASRSEWESRLRALPDTTWHYAHFKRTVEILDVSHGTPPDYALFACAYHWQNPHFGGRVERRPYWHTDECGQRRRYVQVAVYTD